MLSTNFFFISQRSQIIAGLPLPIAALYIFFFATAFWAYTAIWQEAPIMTSDSGGYLAVARDLADFQIAQLHDRTPGYPLLLFLTGSTLVPNRTLFLTSLFLHFASIWLLAAVLYTAHLPAVMLIVFGILLLLPPYVQSTAYVLTENLSEFILVVGFSSLAFWYIRQRMIWILISSLAIGYAGLTRPTYQLLAFVVIAVLFAMLILFNLSPAIHKEMITAILILFCGSAMIIGGYAIFNYKKFDYFGVTPLIGFNLSTRTSNVIERLPQEYAAVREVLIRARDANLVMRDTPHTGYLYISSDVMRELVNITGLEWPQLSKYLTRMNLLLISKAPFSYLLEVTRAFGSYWLPSWLPMSDTLNMDPRSIQLFWAIIHFCLMSIFSITLIVFIGGSIYMMMCKRLIVQGDMNLLQDLDLSRLQGFLYVLAGSIVMYSAVISCLFDVGDSRYRTPTDGLIIFMCFLGPYSVRQLVSLSKIVFCYPCKP